MKLVEGVLIFAKGETGREGLAVGGFSAKGEKIFSGVGSLEVFVLRFCFENFPVQIFPVQIFPVQIFCFEIFQLSDFFLLTRSRKKTFSAKEVSLSHNKKVDFPFFSPEAGLEV